MASCFESSAGLCFPHFAFALEHASDLEVRDQLLVLQRKKLESLVSELKVFITKYDYRRTAEGFAEEKDSWLRAVEMVSGAKNVF